MRCSGVSLEVEGASGWYLRDSCEPHKTLVSLTRGRQRPESVTHLVELLLDLLPCRALVYAEYRIVIDVGRQGGRRSASVGRREEPRRRLCSGDLDRSAVSWRSVWVSRAVWCRGPPPCATLEQHVRRAGERWT